MTDHENIETPQPPAPCRPPQDVPEDVVAPATACTGGRARKGSRRADDAAAPRYHSVAGVATRFGRSPRTIRDWIATGCVTPSGRIRLPAIRAGKALMIDDEDLELFELRLRRATARPSLDLPEASVEGEETR